MVFADFPYIAIHNEFSPSKFCRLRYLSLVILSDAYIAIS